MEMMGFLKEEKMINEQDFLVILASAHALGCSNDFITAAGSRQREKIAIINATASIFYSPIP